MKEYGRKIVIIGAYVAGAILLDLASGYFVLQTGLAICYPPAGLYLAVILLLGWKSLPLAFLNPFFSILVTLHDPSIPFAAAIGIGMASMISPALILAALRRLTPSGDYFNGLRKTAIFAGTILASVAVESLVASFVYILSGLAGPGMFWINAVGWWISNVIPMLTLTPILLLVNHPVVERPKWWRGQLGLLALMVAFLAPLTVLMGLIPGGTHSITRLYIALLPILIGALGGGIFGGVWASLWVTFSVLALAPTYLVNPYLVIEAQFFLLLSNLIGMVTGTIVTDRSLTEARLRESEQRYRQLSVDLEGRVAQRTAQLENKNRELETFAYAVSHDLKAPLRGIDGYSSLLLDSSEDKLDQEEKLFLQNIRQAVGHMSQLIEDLLAYSRLERSPSIREDVNLAAIIEEMLSERQLEIEARPVSLHLDLQCQHILAEPESLSQALRNLIDNAFKFTQAVDTPLIEIGSKNPDQVVIIWVKDNGIGFDMQYSERIFDMFQRLHRVEEYSGTGIGLALVRKAMHRMNGRAWAESAPGYGATFFLEIPQKQR
jgi:signal transduction histidine kinase